MSFFPGSPFLTLPSGSGGTPTPTPSPTLSALSGTFTLAENAAASAVAGAISGKTTGSSLSLTDNAGGRVALSGSNVVRGATALDYESATSHSFTVRETLAGATNTPRDTALSLTVTNVADAPTLAALSLSASTIAEGSAQGTAVGTVVDKTGGSALSLTDSAGGRFQLDSTTIEAGPTATDYEAATSHNITIRETLADSPNSPRDTVIAITVTNVSEVPATIADLAAAAQSDTEVLLTFTPASGATGHEYRVDGGSAVACDDNSGSQTVSGLTAATEYDFEVRGVNAEGNGEWSNVATETTEAPAAAQRNTLLLAFGQSNNISTGTTAANMLADGTSTPAEITAITATGKVKSGYPNESAVFTVADYTPSDSEPDYSVHTWGPEAGFAAAWLEEQTHPDSRLMIIKRSADSSNLGQWVPGQTAWTWVEWLIDGALAWATSNSITWDDLIVLMVNCESEGTNETLADACEARLTTICADVRGADNLGATAKVVMCRLPDLDASYPYLDTVRAAQEAVAAASALNFLIDTDDLLPLRDAYHWMAPDIAEIGARAYAAIA